MPSLETVPSHIFIQVLDPSIQLELSENVYNDMIPHIKENFELSKKYLMSEDYMWENK